MVFLHKYPFLYILPTFVAGIVAYYISESYFNLLFCIGIFSIIVICILTAIHRFLKYISYLCIIAFFCLGYLFTYLNDVKHNPKWCGNHLNNSEYLYVIIDKEPEVKNKTIRLNVAVKGYRKATQQSASFGKLFVYIYKSDNFPNYQIGDKLLLPTDKIIPISSIGNPSAFDYAQYTRYQQYYYQSFLAHTDALLLAQEQQSVPIITQLKNHLSQSITYNVADSITQQLMQAMLLNERALLDDDIWKAYSNTGIIHIIAISGMHVTLLFGILIFLLRFIKHKKYQWIAYCLAIPVVWIYILITGAPASAVRAGIMFSITALSIITQRPEQAINSLLATAFIMLLYNPFWIYDVGMQLSFACMLSIFIFLPKIQNAYQPQNAILKAIWLSFAMSVAVQIITAPIALFYFYQFPIFTFIANIPAALYSTILLIATIIIFILYSIGISASWIAWIATMITNGFNALIQFLAAITPDFFQNLYVDIVDMMLLIIIGSALYQWLVTRKDSSLNLLLSFICFFAISQWIQIYQQNKQQSVVVYNIPDYSTVLKIQHLQYQFITNQALNRDQFQRNIKPSLLHWSSYHESAIQPFILQSINNVHILCISNLNIVATTPFPQPIDVLIIGQNQFENIDSILNLLPSKIVILDSSFKRWQYLELIKILQNKNRIYHNVQTDGAWHSDNFIGVVK